MPQPKILVDGLTKVFFSNPVVTAFTLVGSQAREDIYKATKHSDMEAYVIVKDENADKVEKELPALIKKFGNVLFSFKHAIGFVAVYDDLFRLELPVIKQSEMKSLFSRPKAQTVKILIDKTDGELEKILDNRPETIDFAYEFKNKMINFWYWQILAIQYFIKGEIYNTRAVLNIHASTLIKLFELLNDPNILLLEGNKRIEQLLKEDQLALLREITPTYNKEQIKRALQRVMTIIPPVAKQIKDKYRYFYDKTLDQRVGPKLQKLLDQI